MFAGASSAATTAAAGSGVAGYSLHRPTQPRRNNQPNPLQQSMMPMAAYPVNPLMFAQGMPPPMAMMPPGAMMMQQQAAAGAGQQQTDSFYAGSKLKSGAAVPVGVGFATPMATSNSMMLGASSSVSITSSSNSNSSSKVAIPDATELSASAQPWVPGGGGKKSVEAKAEAPPAPVALDFPTPEQGRWEPTVVPRSDSPLRNFTAELASSRRPPSPVGPRPPSPVSGPSTHQPNSSTIVQSLLPSSLGSSQPMDDISGPSMSNLSALLSMVRQ